jgi:hypothetical protein
MVFGGIGVAGLLIAWLIWLLRPVKPFVLVAIGAGYETNLAVPHNVAGVHGLDAVREWSEQYNKDTKGKTFAVPLERGPDDFKKVIEPLEVGLFDKPPEKLVVYISAHGVARAESGNLVPYLVPNDYTGAPGVVPELFPLERILEALKKLPKTDKLLILDCTTAGAYWPLGTLHNDFARAVKDRLKKIEEEDPKLAVLCSSNEDQRSWADSQLGKTAFSRYLLEALAGKTDHSGAATANTLFKHVSKKVKDWALQNRARNQEPFLLGKEAARNREIVSSPDKAKKSAPAQKELQPDSAVEKELADLWAESNALGKLTPHPAVYTPQLWRLRLDMLLRAEQLARWGEPAKARELLGSLPNVEVALKDLQSAGLTLGMPEALGFRETDAEKELKGFTDLWEDRTQKPEDRKNALLKGLLRLAEPQARARAGIQILEWIAEDPQKNWGDGQAYLKALEDARGPAGCWPAEAHYFKMLQPTPAPDQADRAPLAPLLEAKKFDLLKQAIKVRILAEQAALGLETDPDLKEATAGLPAYSEEVLPWLKAAIEAADTKRRRGEDLLFTSDTDKKYWEEARNLLAGATKDYKEAQDVALKVRAALLQRDLAFAELPYYTHWVADQPQPTAVIGGQDSPDTKISNLWKLVHELRAELDNPSKADAKDLENKAKESKAGVAEVKQDLAKVVEESRAGKENQKSWHDVELALAVPLLKATDRTKLIDDSRRIAKKLAESADKEPAKALDEGQAREAARRQGELAFAVLGDKDAAGKLRAETTNWSLSYAEVGKTIGDRINGLPEQADKDVNDAAAASTLNAAEAKLRAAAGEARLVEGAAVLARRLQSKPVDAQRRLLVQELLCWQAQRTYLDYWADDKPGKHYFQKAGGAFLDDAEKVAAGNADRDKVYPMDQVKEVRKLLNQQGPAFALKGSETGKPDSYTKDSPFYPLIGTDEKECWFELEVPAKDFPGAPVVWVRTVGLGKPSKKDEQHHPEQFWKPFESTLVAAGESADQKHIVHGYFRGHYDQLITRVAIQKDPNLIVVLPQPPNHGNVAIRANGNVLKKLQSPAIIFLLDCSGSMEDVVPGEPGRKIDNARAALKELLLGKDDQGEFLLPEGIIVGLDVFSWHKDKRDPTMGIFETLCPAKPLEGAADRKAILEKLDEVTPTADTPLISSIWKASQHFPALAESRGLVVLTDGADNRFYHFDDNKAVKQEVGQDAIDSFLEAVVKSAQCQLAVIGYGIDESKFDPKPDFAQAEKKSIKELPATVERLGGRYLTAKNREDLVRYLTSTLFKLRYRVVPVGGGGQDAKLGYVSQTDRDENLNWVEVDPGGQEVYLLAARSRRRSLDLRPGDSLLLDLIKGPNFQRALYADYEPVKKSWFKEARDKKSPWVLATMQDEYTDEQRHLQVMTTLEKQPEERAATIRQVRPAWAWFEIAGANPAEKPVTRVISLANYPAPAWEIDVYPWPGKEAAPKLNAWWAEDLPAEPHSKLRQKRDFEALVGLANRSFPGETVTLESVKVKKEKVETEPGKKNEVDCLVIELRYPKESEPYFVRLQGGSREAMGEEHRFYQEAGKYVGVFWPISAREANESIEGLALYSIKKLKPAPALNRELELPPPRPNYQRPNAPR